MRNISCSDAFLIFAKWRDHESQLQINLSKPGKTAGTPAVIIESSPNDESIAALIVANGQTAKWRCDLRGASFQYGEPYDSALYPEFAEGTWSSYLLVEFPGGKTVFFAERFMEE